MKAPEYASFFYFSIRHHIKGRNLFSFQKILDLPYLLPLLYRGLEAVFYLPFDLCLFICLQKDVDFFFSPFDSSLHFGFSLIWIPGRYSFLNSDL